MIETAAVYGFLTEHLLLVSLVCTTVTSWIVYQRRTSLRLPGPLSLPFLGHMLRIDSQKPHRTLYKWFQKYGNIYKMNLLGREIVILSGYDELKEMLVTRGMDFAGRGATWRVQYAYKCTGIAHCLVPDDQWRDLRQICHSHTREVSGDAGVPQSLLTNITEDMFLGLEKGSDTPHEVVLNATVRAMSSLIFGVNISEDDPLFAQLRRYVELSSETMSLFGDVRMTFIDRFPWLRYVNFTAVQSLRKVQLIEKEIWTAMKERLKGRNERTSLGRMLLDAVEFPAKFKSISDQRITDFTAQRTVCSVFVSSIATIANSFHALLQTIASQPNVQANVRKEMSSVLQSNDKEVTLEYRARLHYARAVILEASRYCSIAAFGRTHRALVNTQIGDVKLPANTSVLPNLWAVHHDAGFWEDPDEFRPQRFLDAIGYLVPADHPNRKHLFPFGAGPRMCVGESMALSRLFLWLTNLVRNYKVELGEYTGVTSPGITSCRDYTLDGGTVRCPSRQLKFTKI